MDFKRLASRLRDLLPIGRASLEGLGCRRCSCRGQSLTLLYVFPKALSRIRATNRSGQCGCRLVSKQAAVASVVFVDVQATLLDNLGSSSQCCCDGRIANVWQRLDENFLDFFQ